jgi:hypothetical protein
MPWFFGNLHCHSTNSDGDSQPAEVARFYRDRGFSFVGITDHNHRTGPEDCPEMGPDFAVLGACEYSASCDGHPLHINGIGAAVTHAPTETPASAVAVLQHGIDGFLAQGAFTILNHPNWQWGFGRAELLAVHGAHAMELWNGAMDSDNLGDAQHESTESLWDAALTAGQRLWAVASDDCHHFGPKRSFRSDPPFSGWVAVECERPESRLILDALFAGRFYASNGPRFERLVLARKSIEVAAKPAGRRCRILFIGAGGRQLAAVDGCEARYVPAGGEGYVRVRIESGMGQCAWSQPLFLT